MAAPGQRVGVVDAGLADTRQTFVQPEYDAFERLSAAFREGLVTKEEIMNAMTVNPARRKAEMKRLKSEGRDIDDKDSVREFNVRREKQKARGEAEKFEGDADIEEERKKLLKKPGLAGDIAKARLGQEIDSFENEARRQAALTEQFQSLEGDPFGQRRFIVEQLNKVGEVADPAEGLDALTRRFQDALRKKREETFEDLLLKSRIEGLAKRGEAAPQLEEGLRKEFNARPNVARFETVNEMLSKVREMTSKPTGESSSAEDIGAIFSYMRILDPSSTVREGEFMVAQNATGALDRIMNYYNYLKRGNRLNDSQRKEFRAAAEEAFKSHRVSMDREIARFRGLATRYGADPNNVVEPDHSASLGPEDSPPGFAVRPTPSPGAAGSPAKSPAETKSATPPATTLAPNERRVRLKGGEVVVVVIGADGVLRRKR